MPADESVSRETGSEPPTLHVAPGDVVLLAVPFVVSTAQSDRIAAQIGESIGNGVRVSVLDCGHRYEVIAVFRHCNA